MEKFAELLRLYKNVEAIQSAICVEKGGIDKDNYSGRFFAADLLEFVVRFGEKAGAAAETLNGLRAKLGAKKDLLTPSARPIYEMSLAEFEKLLAYNGDI